MADRDCALDNINPNEGRCVLTNMSHSKTGFCTNGNHEETVAQNQTNSILNRLFILATETPEEIEAREYKEEIEAEFWRNIEGGHSTHGPI